MALSPRNSYKEVMDILRMYKILNPYRCGLLKPRKMILAL